MNILSKKRKELLVIFFPNVIEGYRRVKGTIGISKVRIPWHSIFGQLCNGQVTKGEIFIFSAKVKKDRVIQINCLAIYCARIIGILWGFAILIVAY